MPRSRSMIAVVVTLFTLAGCGGTDPASSPPAKYGNFSSAPQATMSGADPSTRYSDRGPSDDSFALPASGAASAMGSGPADAARKSSPTEVACSSPPPLKPRAATEIARPASPPREPIPAQHTPLPPSFSASGQFRSGTLTAGSLDDHAKYDEFSAYLSKAMQHDRREELPRFSVGRRAVVRVVNDQGQPMGDAQVVIRAADGRALAAAGQGIVVGDSAALLNMKTGADGKVVFLSGLDAPAGGSEFVLTVFPSDAGEPITQRVSLDQTPWQVTLPQAAQQLPRQLDLALVIDTTGSMGDELNYLKVEIDHIAAEVHERFPNVDQRFGLILYRDQGDEYITRSYDFTPSLTDFRRTLAAQSANGGGDYPEAMHMALEQTTQLSWRGAGTARVVFLVADAPPHGQFAQRTLDAVQKLRRAGVTVFPVASSGVKDQAEFIMRAVGFLTQGQYLFLTDHSGVGNPHAKPQAPSYSVEKLDQLMIRMIAEKLSGHVSLPQEVIAVEEPGATPQVDTTSEPTVVPNQPVTVPESPSTIVPMFVAPTSASQPSVFVEIFAVLREFNWWGLAQTLLFVGAAVLLIVVERVRGI
ncbi:MAG: VWA domain-containing protein [Planctomycetales bacterium]|nr:VWA domain-containing protein [Planctomycetales bacterium]